MDNSKQIQRAGENSQQIQAGTVVINQGITEERVRAIYSEMIPASLQSYTSDAYTIANQRIGKLESNVLPMLEKVDGLLEAFGDPAFQLLLGKAQRAAAATERENDYALLSELLVCHVQKGSDRKNRAGINQAVEIVDQIDNDALCAMTVAHAVIDFLPNLGDCKAGLQVLDLLFEHLLYRELPTGTEWLDHLDVLGALRVSWMGKMKKFSEYYPSALNGYVCVGIKRDSDDYQRALEIISDGKIDNSILVENECLDGYVRLGIPNESAIERLFWNNGSLEIPIEQKQKDALKQVWMLYSKDSHLLQQAKASFMSIWDSFESLHKVRLWWEDLPIAFQITRVGKILAHTNAKRCSPDIPDLI